MSGAAALLAAILWRIRPWLRSSQAMVYETGRTPLVLWIRRLRAQDKGHCSKEESRCEDIKEDGTRSSKEGHGQDSRSRTSQEHARRTSTHAARMQSSFKILKRGPLRKNLLDSARYAGQDKTDETRQYRTEICERQAKMEMGWTCKAASKSIKKRFLKCTCHVKGRMKNRLLTCVGKGKQ